MAAGVPVRAGECSQSTNAQSTGISDSTTVTYTVKEGDTLYDIAAECHVALRDLMRVNNLGGSLIRPGDILRLPEGAENGRPSRGSITREELMLLARLIHAEARGESFEGQVAVGAVILNRLANPHFPKTIQEVVFQKSSKVYQFSPVGDGTINLEPDERAIQAATKALSGYDPTGGALFFYNPDISADQWIRTLPVVTRIGNHVFANSI
jgi:N-acetylmuramoyl-L-alanine amidase